MANLFVDLLIGLANHNPNAPRSTPTLEELKFVLAKQGVIVNKNLQVRYTTDYGNNKVYYTGYVVNSASSASPYKSHIEQLQSVFIGFSEEKSSYVIIGTSTNEITRSIIMPYLTYLLESFDSLISRI